MDKYSKYSGFKGMLRDRMQPYMNLALKRCKCKDRYIDYVYRRYVVCKPVEYRSLAVKQVLGLKAAVSFDEIQLWAWRHGKQITRKQIQSVPNELRFFNFEDTIDWTYLRDNDYKTYNQFKLANSWVKWFKIYLPYVTNSWKNLKKIDHYTDAQVQAEFKKLYKLDDGTIKFIIKYLHETTSY